MDVKITLLHGSFIEEIYMIQPLEYEKLVEDYKVSPFVDHLLLKLTPCKWYETTCLLQIVFIKSKVDPNV
jgi:hypothetical protein